MNLEKDMRNIFGHAFFAAAVKYECVTLMLCIPVPNIFLQIVKSNKLFIS